MKPGAGDADGDRVGCVEAKKPDAGFPVALDVGADVEFGEGGECRQRGSAAQANAGHAEWDDADPGFTVKRIDFKRGGDQRTQSTQPGCVDWPVGEEKVVPGLRHDPWGWRNRPW